MSKKDKRRSRFILGAAVGAALVIMALYWRCSGRGAGVGSEKKNVSVPTSTSQATPTKKTPTPPCELRLDSEGLKLDRNPVELTIAVTACKKSGKANLFITGGANYTKLQNTLATLKQANIQVTENRKHPK